MSGDLGLRRAADVPIMAWGACIGTLGKAELEVMAAVLVRYVRVHRLDDWPVLAREDLVEFVRSDPVVVEWSRNPIWAQCLGAGLWDFTERFMTGWYVVDADGEKTMVPGAKAAPSNEFRRLMRTPEVPR